MNKIVLMIFAIAMVSSTAIALIKLTISSQRITKLVAISAITAAIFISVIFMQITGNVKYAFGFAIVYLISQFTTMLHTIYLIQNGKR